MTGRLLVPPSLRSFTMVLALAVLPTCVARAAGPFSIAMVSKGFSQPFWQNVRRGALMAARDFDVAVSFSGPDDGSADTQVTLVSDALAHRPSALCIDALDSRKVLPLLQKARARGIPVIGFDSGADSPLVLCTAATDNAPAAALAANKLAALIGDSGKVGMVLAGTGDPVSKARQKGFAGEMSRRHPGIRLLGPQYSGGDAAASKTLVKLMMQSDPDIAGFFAGDEGSAAGVVMAVQELERAGTVVIVGTDSGQAQLDAIRGGIEAGAVTQDPIRIGYKAVEAAVDALHGRRVPRRIDTGFHWYDRTNIDDPALAILLHP
jgi:ribose transport system substrate-binding protein